MFLRNFHCGFKLAPFQSKKKSHFNVKTTDEEEEEEEEESILLLSDAVWDVSGIAKVGGI